MKLRHVGIIYETVMVVLVILSLFTLFSSNSNFAILHTITWSVFLVDVIVRFIRAGTKWSYLKKNPFDILSIIPFEDMFLLGRFARLVRLFRYKNVVKRYLDRIDKLLQKLNFIKLTIIVLFFNIIVALIMVVFTSNDLITSVRFTFLNFFKFNHQSENVDYTALSIGLKVIGVLYMGIALNKFLNAGKERLDKWRKKRKKDDGVESDEENQEST